MGDASGAGAIFGTTGGVMEAALRTAADILENKDIKEIEYTEIRGEKGIKEANLNINSCCKWFSKCKKDDGTN